MEDISSTHGGIIKERENAQGGQFLFYTNNEHFMINVDEQIKCMLRSLSNNTTFFKNELARSVFWSTT